MSKFSSIRYSLSHGTGGAFWFRAVDSILFCARLYIHYDPCFRVNPSTSLSAIDLAFAPFWALNCCYHINYNLLLSKKCCWSNKFDLKIAVNHLNSIFGPKKIKIHKRKPVSDSHSMHICSIQHISCKSTVMVSHLRQSEVDHPPNNYQTFQLPSFALASQVHLPMTWKLFQM